MAAAHEAPLPLLVVALARGQDVPDLLGRAAARGDGVGLPRALGGEGLRSVRAL